MRRTRACVGVLLLAAAVSYAVGQKEEAPAKEIFIGLDTKSMTDARDLYLRMGFEWFCEDNKWKWIANDGHGDPGLQITQSKQMISAGINGLIVSAQDAEAARPIVGLAGAAHVPVFTVDADIDSPDVKMYIGFSEEQAAAELARRIVDFLKTRYKGEVKGTVLEITGGSSSIGRSRGFHSVMDTCTGVTLIQAAEVSQAAPARTVAADALRDNPPVDACFAAAGPMAVGAVEAMKDLGMDPRKVFTVTIDAAPEVLSLIKSGDISLALDQPVAFYTAIAARYCARFILEGASALPKPGDAVRAGDLKLDTGVKHAGTLIWGDSQAWAPAAVVKGLAGHPWLQVPALQVTKANADAPSLWANVKLPGE